jgi:hypothetical protein
MQTGDLFSETKRSEIEADQSPYLVSVLRMSGAILPLPHTLSWRVEKLIFLYLPLSMTHFLDQTKPYDTAGEHKDRAYKGAYPSKQT